MLLGQRTSDLLLDITDIVRSFLADPGSNHGLVVGSLSGSRAGLFTLKEGTIAPGVVARVTFHLAGFLGAV